MEKVRYIVKGFDCPNCAAASEEYLRKQDAFAEATLDFNNGYLYLTYKDKKLNKDQVLALIKNSTDDEIELFEEDEEHKESHEKLFTKDTLILLIRILLATTLSIVARVLYPNANLFWVCLSLYIVAYLIIAYDIIWELIENIIKLRNPIDENLLMVMASAGAFLLVLFDDAEPAFFDGVFVIVLFQIGELIEHFLTHKSKTAINKAIDIRANTANLIVGKDVKVVNPSELKVGDLILIKVGEIIPVDGEVISGSGNIDVSSLTGEPLPIGVEAKSKVLSGSILRDGSLTIKVEKEYKNSTISKILDLVQSSGERKAKIDKFITKFARVYTPVVLGIGILFAIIFGLVTSNWGTAIYRGISILVIACPCAIVLSVPLAYFAGIGLASKNGIVIKGASYLEGLANSGVLFIDKTGTLTLGNFEVSKVVNKVDLVEFNNTLLIAESRSNHPLAKAILKGKKVLDINPSEIDYHEIAGGGTLVNYKNDEILAGSRLFLNNNGVEVSKVNEVGTVIHLAKNKAYYGYVVLEDIIRDNAKELVSKLSKAGVRVVLLSGDNENNVEKVSKVVGIKEYHSNLLPQDKTSFVNAEIEQKTNKKSVLFAGDGINDTPSIKRADIGFAMGGVGSDAAIENADIILMNDDPMKIHQSITIGKMTKRTAIFNIVVALLVKLLVMILAMTVPNFPIEIDVASDTGLTILLVINSLLLIYRKVK